MENPSSSKGGRAGATQFKATALWEQIISYFSSNVKLRQRHYFLRAVPGCFSGADATTTVLMYLLTDQTNFSSSEISRTKAVKVCQLMLDDGIFCPVSVSHKSSTGAPPKILPGGPGMTPMKASSGGRKRPVFRDSANKLYQFPKGKHRRTACKDLSDNNNGVCGGEEFTGLENPGFSERSLNESLMEELLDMTTCCRPSEPQLVSGTPHRAPTARSNTTPSTGTRVLSSSTTSCLAFSASKPLSQKHTLQAFQHCQREVLLRSLLEYLDVSHLDDLIWDDTVQQPTYDNIVFFDPSDSLEEQGLQSDYLSDPLVELAAAVLDFLPKGRDSFHRACSRSLRDCKLLLHRRIESHYGDLPGASSGGVGSLLPGSHAEAYYSIARLIEGREVEKARKALNTALLLLPWHRLCEVDALIKYLDEFGRTDLQLQGTCLSEVLVRAFIHSSVMPSHRAKLLVGLMIKHCQDICQMPPDIQSRIDLAISGKTAEKVYCQRIPVDQFHKQSTSFTENQIVSLINSIADHPSLSLKEKASKLKSLRKVNPVLFATHFPQLADLKV